MTDDPLVFTVAKADSSGKEPSAGAVLHITGELGKVRETLPRAAWRSANLDLHVMDAQQVAAALAHLPQGTLDQVLVLLLQQRASLLRVACPFPPASCIEGLPEEIRRDDRGERPSLPRITPESAAGALWFALRHLVPAAAKRPFSDRQRRAR